MRALLIIALCGSLAACSQTAEDPDAYTSGPKAQSRPVAAAAPKGRQEACEKAIRDQANAGMIGGALGMVGGFGGFGGRGGAVAAQVASSAGGMIARAQAQQAQTAVMRDCNGRPS